MKALLILTGAFYALLGFSARLATDFIDMKSFDAVINRSLPVLIIVSLVVGILFGLWFKQAFPVGFAKQSRLIRTVGLPLLFSCLAFGIQQGWVFTLNTWFVGERRQASVFVTDKRTEKSKRSNSYRLVSVEKETNKIFEFKVAKKIYNQAEVNQPILLDLKCGAFGIYFGEVSKGERKTGLEPAAFSLGN